MATALVAVSLTATAVAPATAAGRQPSPLPCTPPHGCETPLDTDAPTQVRVGAMVMFPTVTVITREPARQFTVALADPGKTVPGWGNRSEPEPGRPTVFKVPLTLTAVSFERWGQHSWEFYGFRVDGPQDTVGTEITGRLPVDVRAHSMLGVTTFRSGGAVAVSGSLRAFSTTAERYAAWSGRPVSVQRWTGSAWVQVAGVSTDSRGNFTTSVRVPAGSELRAVVKDVPAIWGAVSANAKA